MLTHLKQQSGSSASARVPSEMAVRGRRDPAGGDSGAFQVTGRRASRCHIMSRLLDHSTVIYPGGLASRQEGKDGSKPVY